MEWIPWSLIQSLFENHCLFIIRAADHRLTKIANWLLPNSQKGHYLGLFQNNQTVNQGGKFHTKKESLSLLPSPTTSLPCSFLWPWIPGSDYQQTQSLFTSTRIEAILENKREGHTQNEKQRRLSLSLISHITLPSLFFLDTLQVFTL